MVGGTDASPSQSCNASQFLLKSLMKSYNAGNVQFYENLHRKYFDKAKGGKEDEEVCDPPSALLDMTDDNMVSKIGGEMSRFLADSRLNGSRSRSRSRGGNSNNLLQGSKISSVNFAGVSKFKGSSKNHFKVPNEASRTAKDLELDQTQGA
mmetsp:Transcript_13343/g.16897  ORF Transcript_13343/g.16897 Transcript_13343/m.16897 type:complete len:151 (+) Transcript_13343:114-566(+)